MFRNISKITAFSALAAVCGSSVSAQADWSNGANTSSPGRGYHLVQWSVDTRKVPLQAFADKAQTINSCDDAYAARSEMGGKIVRNQNVSQRALPIAVKFVLERLPEGKATQVISDDGVTARILVICNRP